MEEKQRLQVIDLFAKGLSVSKISKHLKVVYTDVLQCLFNNGANLSAIKTKFTPEQEIAIVIKFKDGASPHKISEILGVSRMAVHSWLIVNGFKINEHLLDKKLSNKQKEEIRQLYISGENVSYICRQYNVTNEALKRLLCKLLPNEEKQINFKREVNGLSCKICGCESRNWNCLSRHLRDYHKLDIQDNVQKYYDLYLKKENEGKCVICGQDTHFKNIREGYPQTCCHKHGAFLFRERLRNDIDKFDIFKKKVSNNQKRWWSELSADEKCEQMGKSIRGLKIYVTKLTKSERRQIYGWMNRLSATEKQNFIDNIMLKTGSHRWWKTATDDQVKRVIDKRRDTVLKKRGYSVGIEGFNEIVMAEYKYYRREVYRMSEKIYDKFQNIINNSNIPRSRDWQLDHRYSVSQGFIDRIDPVIISSPYNLQMLSFRQNNSKNYKCGISKEELLKQYNEDALQTRNIHPS